MKPTSDPAKEGRAFADNLYRLAGLHGLNDIGLSKVLGVTPSAVSSWRHGRREPGGGTVLAISEVFEVPPHLLTGEFETLLPLVADPRRFKRTEKRIHARKRGLESVS